MKSRILFSLSLFLSFVGWLTPVVQAQTTVYPKVQQAPSSCTFTYAAGASNQTSITIKENDSSGNPIPFTSFRFWVADSSDGAPITATQSSGAVNILASSGQYMGILTTSLTTLSFWSVLTTNAGIATIGITDSAKTLWFPTIEDEGGSGSFRCVGPKLATASYGYLFGRDLDITHIFSHSYDQFAVVPYAFRGMERIR